MQYRYLHVTDKTMLDKVFRFRYAIMHEEFGWVDSNLEKREADQYDPYSDHFAVLDSKNRVCASMRLIHDSPLGYPTEKFVDPQTLKTFDPATVCEMSRIFIAPQYRNMRHSKIIINGILKELAYKKMKEYGMTYCYGALESSFLKLLNIFGIPYHPIGEAHLNYGKQRYPCILVIKELELKRPDLNTR